MEAQKTKRSAATIISSICLILSLCLLVAVCGYCYPQLEQQIRQAVAGVSDNPVQEAFSVLADGLTESKPVKEVLAQSYEALTGGQD